jgi:poly(3-hydroxybutyrate) depolymerase
MRRTVLIFAVAILGCSSTPDAGDGSAGNDGGDEGATQDDSGMTDDGMSGNDSGADSGPPCTADANKTGIVTRTVKNRKYLSYAPSSYMPGTPLPLVLALHGAGDTNSNYLNVMWKANADTKGFIVIAPEGSAPLGNGYTWQTGDRAYILSTIDDVRACYDLQPKKTIIHGFSAGGIMAYWIGLKDANRFSGIAINSADLGSAEAGANGGIPLLPAPWTIPVSHFHGDQDMNFPIMYAQAGIDRLKAAGHMTYFHIFSGGHTATPMMAAQEYDDLISSSSP